MNGRTLWTIYRKFFIWISSNWIGWNLEQNNHHGSISKTNQMIPILVFDHWNCSIFILLFQGRISIPKISIFISKFPFSSQNFHFYLIVSIFISKFPFSSQKFHFQLKISIFISGQESGMCVWVSAFLLHSWEWCPAITINTELGTSSNIFFIRLLYVCWVCAIY